MLTQKQLEIFAGFKQNIFKNYTIKELKDKLKIKSNNAFSIAINKFKEENLIFEEKIGRNSIYSLNLDNLLVYTYLDLINLNDLDKSIIKSIKLLVNSLNSNNINFYSLVIFGSYAKNTQTKSSDLDIAIIVNKKSKQYQVIIENLKLKSLIDLDIHIIEEEEFNKMLKVDYENLGKEIARKNKPIINSYIFYNILKKGVQNGFNL
jgi:predicted nucleotidyltransferase